MFGNSSIYVMSPSNKIYRLETDLETQKGINDTFSSAVLLMTDGKSCIDFDGNYKPEADEFLRISDFRLPEVIKEAIKNPVGVTAYEKDSKEKGNKAFQGYPKIKAVFVGERFEENGIEFFNIAFQRFRKEQNLMALKHMMFWNDSTFQQVNDFGIGITDTVDCIFSKFGLCFNSYYYARQIFDLKDYYRIATEKEVNAFSANNRLYFENADLFISFANKASLRRKIALINDSGVLENFTAKQIKELASKAGLTIKIKNNKIVIPDDKDRMLVILATLNEEAYRGMFTNNLIVANSKRIVAKV